MRIASWNMQGGSASEGCKNNILNCFFRADYDVICLQEATNPLETFTESIPASGIFAQNRTPRAASLREHPSNKYVCCKFNWGTVNTRCTLVTYVKSAIFINWGLIAPPVTGRSMLWVQVTLPGFAPIRIGNVHLISGVSDSAFLQFCHFKETLDTWGGGYAIVGDFNMIPDFLEDKTAPILTINIDHFHHPGVSTQKSGGILDYVYYNGAISSMQCLPSNFDYSDHKGLTCEF